MGSLAEVTNPAHRTSEFVSIDEPDADNETETPVADTEEAEADLLLEVDQDEKLDPTEIVEGGIEKDDT